MFSDIAANGDMQVASDTRQPHIACPIISRWGASDLPGGAQDGEAPGVASKHLVSCWTIVSAAVQMLEDSRFREEEIVAGLVWIGHVTFIGKLACRFSTLAWSSQDLGAEMTNDDGWVPRSNCTCLPCLLSHCSACCKAGVPCL